MKDFLQESRYKKSGKIYTPPILQLGEYKDVHWINELIPEFFWIGLLQQKYGFGNGSNISSKVVTIALQLSEDKNIWLAPWSAFSNFSDIQKQSLKSAFSRSNILTELQDTFLHINYLYPDFPFNFLFNDNKVPFDNDKLDKFKIFIASIYDRTSISANLIQGVALDMIFRSDIDMKFHSGSSLAEFPKFEEYPTTDISIKVASGIRSCVNMIYLNYHKPNSTQEWQNYFWNRGLQIDECI